MIGLLVMLLTGFELVRAYLTNTTFNVLKRGARVGRGADPGLFWFSVAAEAGFFSARCLSRRHHWNRIELFRALLVGRGIIQPAPIRVGSRRDA